MHTGADQQPNVSVSLHFTQHTDHRRYNISTTSTEVAAMIPYVPNANTRDIVLQLRNPPGGQSQLKRMHDRNPAFDTLSMQPSISTSTYSRDMTGSQQLCSKMKSSSTVLGCKVAW